MSESDPKNHWKSLADEIGAEIPEEPEPQPADEQLSESHAEQPLEPQAAMAPKPTKKPPAPTPVRRTNHWSLLAGELGLEVPELPEPAEPEPAEPPAEVVASETADAYQSEPHYFASHREPEAAAEVDAETSDIDYSPEDFSTTADLFDHEIDDLSVDQSGDEEESPVEPVGASEDTDEQRDDGRRRRKRRGRRRRRRGEDDAESAESAEGRHLESETIEIVSVGSTEFEEIEVVVEAEDGDDESEDDDTPAESKERRGRKRRRRRGARRSRGRDEAASEEDDEASASADSSSEDDGLDDEDSDDSDTTQGGRTKHRKIPSWQEALVGMIDSNIKNHASSDNSGRRGRGRRGRP